AATIAAASTRLGGRRASADSMASVCRGRNSPFQVIGSFSTGDQTGGRTRDRSLPPLRPRTALSEAEEEETEMTTTLLESPAREMVAQVEPVLRKYAAQNEADRRLAPEVIEALVDSGITRAVLPKAYGGFEMDPVSGLKLLEDVSRI